MILFLILIVLIAVLVIRSQMHRQHREMMSAVNPERLQAIDAANRAEDRRRWFMALSALGGIVFFIILGYGCGQIAKFKGFVNVPDHPKTEAQP